MRRVEITNFLHKTVTYKLITKCLCFHKVQAFPQRFYFSTHNEGFSTKHQRFTHCFFLSKMSTFLCYGIFFKNLEFSRAYYNLPRIFVLSGVRIMKCSDWFTFWKFLSGSELGTVQPQLVHHFHGEFSNYDL